MSEPYEVTTAADRAIGLRRYCDRTGREWTVPRPARARFLAERDGVPEGFRKIALIAYTDGRQVIVPDQSALPLPCETVEGDHDCDANGCGWEHVLARFLLPREREI